MSDPSSTTSGQANKFLSKVYGLKTASEAKDLYNEWATEYDHDLDDTEYNSPHEAVNALIRNSSPTQNDIVILDAGCGTGLVGEQLAASPISGHFTVDGLDISDGMLAVARKKNVYRNLHTADLSQPLKLSDGTYNAILCVGTLTKGHVGPVALREFARVCAKDGLIVATVHDEIFQSGGYKDMAEDLQRDGEVAVVGMDEFGIMKGASSGGRMIVLRKK